MGKPPFFWTFQRDVLCHSFWKRKKSKSVCLQVKYIEGKWRRRILSRHQLEVIIILAKLWIQLKTKSFPACSNQGIVLINLLNLVPEQFWNNIFPLIAKRCAGVEVAICYKSYERKWRDCWSFIQRTFPCKYYLDRRASMHCELISTRYRRPPLVQGGLIVVCRVTKKTPVTMLHQKLSELY